MRAVNLVPRDSRRGGMGPSLGRIGASHLVIALLVIALGFVTLYVLTSNKVSQRKTQLATLQQQVTRMQAQVARLQSYQQFEKLAQARADTVRQIAATRFDWHGALSDLSKVVPTNTTLQSLAATAAPGAGSAGGAASGSGSNVRGDINAPAFELKGCTATQDDVAQLMSRLRLVNGVTRVTLEDSTKPGAGQAAGTVGTSSASSGAGCASNGPAFDMVVFFQPVAGAAAITGSAPGQLTPKGAASSAGAAATTAGGSK